MSKAFTKENDETDDLPLAAPANLLPENASNYLTPEGAHRLRQELVQLAGRGHPENAQRIRRIKDCLDSAVVVGPPTGSSLDRIQFGANVRVREPDGTEVSYRIVGIDEADPERGWISWMSPVAKALLNKRTGDRVGVKVPGGDMSLEILEVSYRGVS